ncbi:MAG: histone deacetylase family protein [Ktedonobacterales bacterium]
MAEQSDPLDKSQNTESKTNPADVPIDEPSSNRLPTALIYDPAFLDHRVPDGFPEEPERLRRSIAMIDALIEQGTLPAEHILRLTPRSATHDEINAVHEERYVERLRRAVDSLIERNGPDGDPQRFANEVYISSGSYRAATLAAGAPLVALDAIGEGRARNGYALVRPPGHHATRTTGMGFCIFNNIAIAARYAQRRWGWQRVLIVDYDVHHGNGTQDIFYEDGDVLYFSTHQFPLYPGTGASTERGAGPGLGATVNVPLPAESGWSVYDPIFRQVLWPVADRFKPDIVLLSAGFDAHWRDPLAEMRLSTADYSDLTLEVAEIADRYSQGRILAVQEGGYDLDAVAQCASTVLVALTGSDGIVDNLGQPQPIDFRWNEEAIIKALYDLHGLAGYRRKARRPIEPSQMTTTRPKE